MPQQLLHPPQVKTRPHEVNAKAVPERVRMNVNVNHLTILLNDVPDLHAREGKHMSKLRDVVH
jgi:hypothetical protein